MGLDQYLKATALLLDYDNLREEAKTPEREKLSEVRDSLLEALNIAQHDGQGMGIFAPPPSVSVTITVAYWRKCNQIHKFFNNLSIASTGNPLENCKELEVTCDDIRRLVSECEQVLDDNELAEDLLPTEGGFFYGPTEYGDYYFDGLRQTIQQLKPFAERQDLSFSYYGWW